MTRDTPPRPEYRAEGFNDDHHTTLLGAAYGMRNFRIDDEGWLIGLTYRARWVNGTNVAKCYNANRGARRHGGDLTAAEPGPEDRSHSMIDCGCGLWAYFHAIDPFDTYGGSDTMGLCGIVRMWGRSVIGTKGTRSLYAQVVALAEPFPSQMRLMPFQRAFGRLSGHYSNIAWYADRDDMLRAWPLSSHYRGSGARE